MGECGGWRAGLLAGGEVACVAAAARVRGAQTRAPMSTDALPLCALPDADAARGGPAAGQRDRASGA
eukprot:1547791-Rhodomonas_salina.1